MKPERVHAAGGVVVDPTGRMLVVHRPRYDDWTFPKGKLDPGETIEECALREVREETGYSCELLELVATIRYVDHVGRDKDVRYWRMRALGGFFEPNDEVDAIAWLLPDEVAETLTYPRDLEVLHRAEEVCGLD
ncbi:MAG: NUDIX hydrolase [Acidimicrobiales bacterium]